MKKPIKWALAAIGVILLLVLAAIIFLDDWVEHRIEKTLAEKVSPSNNLQYAKLDVSIFPGALEVKNISADMSLGKWQRTSQVKIPALKFSGIDWLSLVFSKNLDIGSLQIESPTISVVRLHEPDSIQPKKQDAGKKKPGKIECVNIGKVTVLHGQFRFVSDTASLPELQADTFNLDLGEFSLKMENEEQPLKVVSTKLELYNLMRRDEDNLHEISLRQLSWNSQDSIINISGFKVEPKYSKKEFSRQVKYKQSRIALEFPKIQLAGWQFNQLMKGNLVARTVDFDNVKLNVFSDRNLPLDSKSYKKFPHETLLQAVMGITLDTIRFKNAEVVYENLGKDRNIPGKLLFSDIRGVFTNVTNDSVRISQNPTLEVDLKARLQEKYSISKHIWMNLSSPTYDFTYTGHAENIPFEVMNPFLKHTQNVTFERGMIRKLDYRINADHKRATGTLNLEYEDLEFALLDEQKEKRKMLSRLVDLLFVPDNNEKSDGDFQKGIVHAVRDVRRSFYYFTWSAIQSGIQSTILSEKAAGRLAKGKKK